MLGLSYVFYGWVGWSYCLLLLATTPSPSSAVRPSRRRKASGPGGWPWAVSCAALLGLLGWFKYYGFVSVNLDNLTHALGLGRAMPLFQVALPIAISFYTFMALSYVIDIYRRQLQPARPLDLALYLSFFPHLLAGPIVRGNELLPQLRRRRDPRRVDYSRALWLIMAGLFKKVVISSYVSTAIVQPVFTAPAQHSAPEAIFAAWGYAVQIYCDFSGYTDIAIGLALLLGIRFPINFDAPYTARDLQDFWRRWHITLSRWLRDYLYIPLGGSSGSEAQTVRNIMITMVLGGLWHGAAWTFVFWGALHGVGQAVGHLRRRSRVQRGLPAVADGPVRIWVAAVLDVPVRLPGLGVLQRQRALERLRRAGPCAHGLGEALPAGHSPPGARYRRDRGRPSSCPPSGWSGCRPSSPGSAPWSRSACSPWPCSASPPSGPSAWPPSSTTASDGRHRATDRDAQVGVRQTGTDTGNGTGPGTRTDPETGLTTGCGHPGGGCSRSAWRRSCSGSSSSPPPCSTTRRCPRWAPGARSPSISSAPSPPPAAPCSSRGSSRRPTPSPGVRETSRGTARLTVIGPHHHHGSPPTKPAGGSPGGHPIAAGGGSAPPTTVPGMTSPTAAHPLRVLILGDSLGIDMGGPLQNDLANTGVVQATLDARESTGLTRPDYFNWPAELQSDLGTAKPQVVVVMIGANDPQDFPGPPDVPYSSPQWNVMYAARAAAFMQLAQSEGATVVWVGMPPMQRAQLSTEMADINAIDQHQAALSAPPVDFISSWTLLGTPQGAYTPFITNGSGQVVNVRTPDGIHLTPAGGEVLSQAVLNYLRGPLHIQLP